MKEHLMALLFSSAPFYSAPLCFAHFRNECFIFLLQILPLQGWKVVMVSSSRATTEGNGRMWEPHLPVLMMIFHSVGDILYVQLSIHNLLATFSLTIWWTAVADIHSVWKKENYFKWMMKPILDLRFGSKLKIKREVGRIIGGGGGEKSLLFKQQK